MGPLFGDGTSVSIGTASRGALRHGVALPSQGDGYVIPPTWRARGSSYGTDELIEALVRSARAVARELPGGWLGVADLSPRGGGASVKHRSHENGRDVDLIYFAADPAGRPLKPADAMIHYDAEGVSRAWRPDDPHDPPPSHGWEATSRRFDVARNWALVRALIDDPAIEVQWIFMAEHLRQRVLDYAAQRGESAALIDRAAWILHRPTDSQPHDDHMHVRVLCDALDRAFGCVDHGPVRWWKKNYKYMEPALARLEQRAVPEPLLLLGLGPGGLFASALHPR